MTRLDEIIASALAGIPETDVAILAREVVRLRGATSVVVPELLAVEKFADNGSHSHWIIIRRDTGGAVWEEPDPDEDSRTEIPLPLQSIPADRVLGDGALLDDRDRLLSDLVRIRETSSNVLEYLDDRFSFCSGNAPGHAHSRPGIWDEDNGVKSGTECEWCQLWGAFRAEIERGGAKSNQGGADHA